MPVSLTSRYRRLPVYQATDAAGKAHPTIPIRPARPLGPDANPVQHVVAGADDIEYLAWRYYRASEDWWRIADANPLIFPLDLRTGERVSIPSVSEIGRVERTRSF